MMETSKSSQRWQRPRDWWKPGQGCGLKILPELQTERLKGPVRTPISSTVNVDASLLLIRCTGWAPAARQEAGWYREKISRPWVGTGALF